MHAATIPQETESLLVYLLNSTMRSARTLTALRNICPDETTIDTALQLLIDYGYVCDDNGAFELTFDGIHNAQEIESETYRQPVNLPSHPQSVREQDAEDSMPNLYTHPLRTDMLRNHTVDAAPQVLHYMLAFETPKDILPIPVLDGDTLGRLSDASISLTHDDYISGKHCRFHVMMENEQPVLVLEDLGSRNGTRINDFRMERGGVFKLQHGSRIQVGGTVLIVVKIPY